MFDLKTDTQSIVFLTKTQNAGFVAKLSAVASLGLQTILYWNKAFSDWQIKKNTQKYLSQRRRREMGKISIIKYILTLKASPDNSKIGFHLYFLFEMELERKEKIWVRS